MVYKMIQDSYILTFVKREIELHVQLTLSVFVCALLLIWFMQWAVKWFLENKSLPPGPLGIPIFGILKFIGHEKHKEFMKLAKTYGTLFSARLGSQLYIVISDYKLIRETFKKEEFTGRPKTPLYQILNGLGVINAEGKLWKDQRRFINAKLRNFGMTYMGSKKNVMEKLIMTEVTDLVTLLKETKNEPTDMNPLLAVSVSNVICNLLMSVRFTKDDPMFKRFTYLIEEGMRLFGKIHAIDYIPITQYFPSTQTAKHQISQNRQEMFIFYKEVIEEHRRTFDSNNLRDLVDTYLYEIEKAKEQGCENELFEGNEHDEHIMQVLGDLFSAGMETIKSTLLWTIVFMLRNPKAMKKVQDELDTIVGRHRMPQIEDLQYLPTTETTIMEVMRISSIVPLATTHTPLIDVELNGFKIPAGAHCVPLINCVHMDKKLWDRPEDFNPSRFINAEGKVFKPDFFMPFGAGRRMCLGHALSRMELFLFFANIMHTFNITLPIGDTIPTLNGNAGVTISPDQFRVCFTERPLLPCECDDQTTPIRNFGSV